MMSLTQLKEIMQIYSIILSIGLVAPATKANQIRTDTETDRRIHNLETELSKLRMLHTHRIGRIRDLEQEVTQYQTIFQGLALLCSTMQQKGNYSREPRVETPKDAIKPTVQGITAHSVTTAITKFGETSVVQITVQYSTTEAHEVIWAYNVLGHMVPIQDDDPYSSVQTEREAERFITRLYISADALKRLELLYVKLLSEFSEVTLLFNKESILKGEDAKLLPIKLGNESPTPQVLVFDPEENGTISVNVDNANGNIVTYINFIGIDQSKNGNVLVDLQQTDRRLTSKITNTTNGIRWSVNLASELIKIGGMLSMRVVQQSEKGPVMQLHVGKTIYIIPKQSGLSKAPFPVGSLALLSLYQSTAYSIIMSPPIGAIWCYAFGNPAPKTKIIKFGLGGRQEVLKGRVFNIGQYDTAQVVLLQNLSSLDGGQYLCEASSGMNVVSEPVVVKLI